MAINVSVWFLATYEMSLEALHILFPALAPMETVL